MELANVLLTHTLMFIVTAFPWKPTYSNSAFRVFTAGYVGPGRKTLK